MRSCILLSAILAVTGCAPVLSPVHGATAIGSREEFDHLSDAYTIPGGTAGREVKFLIAEIHSPSPDLYFLNAANYPDHYTFYRDVRGIPLTLYEFNLHTYYPFDRQIIAGSVVAHPVENGEDFYTFEFWPADRLTFDELALTHGLLSEAMFCQREKIIYHPGGQSQVNAYLIEQDSFLNAGIPVITTDSLYGDQEYIPLNCGTAVGVLRGPDFTGTFSPSDIAVFRTPPNTLSHVAGVLTTSLQAPLSHVNLLARQNGIPNASVPGLLECDSVTTLFGSMVKLQVRSDGYQIERAIAEEFNAHWDSLRPDTAVFPERNLTVTDIRPLHEMDFRNWTSIGAKAANLAELGRILPENLVPHGVAVPFFYYDSFFRANGLYDTMEELMACPEFSTDADFRRHALEEYRELVEAAPVPQWMLDSLGTIQDRFPEGTSLRCRSSTNTEDLPGFSGAGLYRSYTHHPCEGHIANTIRQVWAGLWTYRAFQEREFYRIDHFRTAMGVLVHPSYRGELANGVAVSRNILDPAVPGCYVNAQTGEDLVTNPEELSVPDVFTVMNTSPLGEEILETVYIGFSNRTEPGEHVLSEEQTHLLSEYLQRIHEHFSFLQPYDLHSFAMEVEFKITADGELVIKQARPWVNR
ncbi:hypothetical protein CSA37_09205 [Candidatus Fermentibacteria bacterium]|nr:MAG: hypothetical protein CSA37_09205 [Candidatus Fermentibacteria bacterium]